MEIPRRIPCRHRVLVVIDDVIDVLHVALAQRIAAMGIRPKIVDHRHGAGLKMAIELLLADRVGEKAVLDRDIDGARGINIVVCREFEAAVVHDDIVRGPHVGRVRVGIGRIGARIVRVQGAVAEMHVTADDVFRPIERGFGAKNLDAPRRRLPLDAHIAGDRYGRQALDAATYVEDHDVPTGRDAGTK